MVEGSATRVLPGVSGPLPSLPVVRGDIYGDVPTRGLIGWPRLPVVLDTSILLNDILDAARGHGGSLLLLAARKDVAHLYATERVREEVERHLARRATEGHVPVESAFQVWDDIYLPLIRFVPVDGVPRGRAARLLADRDPKDLPTAVLAELLAPCLVFSKDNDLLDTEIARHDWTTIVHNAEEAKQLEILFGGGGFITLMFGTLGYEGAKGVVRLARAAPLPTLLGAAVLTLIAHSHFTSTRGRQQITDGKSFAKEAGHRLGRVIDAASVAKAFVQEAAFVLEVQPTELGHAARAVAVAPYPPRASEVAYEMNVSTQKAAYLLRNPLFTRLEDGTYALGRQAILSS
jgi:hypothetical protein